MVCGNVAKKRLFEPGWTGRMRFIKTEEIRRKQKKFRETEKYLNIMTGFIC